MAWRCIITTLQAFLRRGLRQCLQLPHFSKRKGCLEMGAASASVLSSSSSLSGVSLRARRLRPRAGALAGPGAGDAAAALQGGRQPEAAAG